MPGMSLLLVLDRDDVGETERRAIRAITHPAAITERVGGRAISRGMGMGLFVHGEITSEHRLDFIVNTAQTRCKHTTNYAQTWHKHSSDSGIYTKSGVKRYTSFPIPVSASSEPRTHITSVHWGCERIEMSGPGPLRTTRSSPAASFSPYGSQGRRTPAPSQTSSTRPLQPVIEEAENVPQQGLRMSIGRSRLSSSTAGPARTMLYEPWQSSEPRTSSPPPTSPTPASRSRQQSSLMPLDSAFSGSTAVGRDQREQRNYSQKIQMLEAAIAVNNQQNDAILQRLAAAEITIFNLSDTCKNQQQAIQASEEHANELTIRIDDLESTIDALQSSHATSSTAEGSSQEDRRAVKVLLKQAIKILHGCDAPVIPPLPGTDVPLLEAANGEAGGDRAMRWDYIRKFRDRVNAIETQRLLTYLQNKRDEIPLPNDIRRDDIPPYTTNSNLYIDCISDIFRAYRKSFYSSTSKTWETETKAEVEAAIIELKEQLANPTPQGDPAELAKWEGFVAEMDKLVQSAEADDKGNVRSKLVVLARQFKGKRMHTEAYHGPEYACMEQLHCLPAPTSVKSDDGSREWYWPAIDGVFSQTYLNVFNTIYETRDPLIKNPSDIAVVAPAEFQHPPYEHYWATTFPKLHENPQRWMFDPAWLQAQTSDIIDLRVVPVDHPMDPEEVKDTQWYINHPQQLGRLARTAGKAAAAKKPAKKKPAKKNTRSVSIDMRSSQPPTSQSQTSLSTQSQPTGGPGPSPARDDGMDQQPSRIMKGRSGPASSSVTPRIGPTASEGGSRGTQLAGPSRQPPITQHLANTRFDSESNRSSQQNIDPMFRGSTYNKHSLRGSSSQSSSKQGSQHRTQAASMSTFIPPLPRTLSTASMPRRDGSSQGLSATLYNGSPGLGRPANPFAEHDRNSTAQPTDDGMEGRRYFYPDDEGDEGDENEEEPNEGFQDERFHENQAGHSDHHDAYHDSFMT
ncbi:hypothetical protein HD553DRAFT_324946 [Filobasidium floriforme]|uniref:uncharacterized protein n=1 Tax=Filobasidium floriforme TaxID=5210 RepID=UPI001E8DD13F|nr:uncharacterized protein HD553DRAFT_324946 [Filobasidium floriforme]KAH8082680.1 hypothetical protein HD553DRAFT_324946 [Filobasidium floriforme]